MSSLFKPKISRRAVAAWFLYDWGNSAFSTIVLTFIFAAYFVDKIAVNKYVGTSQWANTVALAGLLIAILSPVLGSIADREGRRKPWIGVFAAISILSAALLWFSKPYHSYVNWTLGCLFFGIVGLEVSMVFYNAMLKDIAPKNYIGRFSGWSWGLGYLGGLSCLVIAFLFFINDQFFHLNLNVSEMENVRYCGILVALWYFIFSIPLFLWTPDHASSKMKYSQAVKLGIKELIKTLRALPKYKIIFIFLIARMIYTDGLNTIFMFGGIYATGTFHMSLTEMVEFGIGMNVAAGIGAISFGWLDDYIGSKKTILISLGVMIISGLIILFTKSSVTFWIFGMGLSLCVGPIQAASRSLMTRLAPPHLVTEMFGLYAFSGKATSFMGPWLVGTLTVAFQSQRAGMSAIMVFLLLGGLGLLCAKIP